MNSFAKVIYGVEAEDVGVLPVVHLNATVRCELELVKLCSLSGARTIQDSTN